MSYIGKGVVADEVLVWSSASNGWLTGTQSGGGGGGGGGDGAAQYLVLSATASLSAERVFTPGTGLLATDGGAGGAYTVNVSDSVIATVSGTTFSGDVLMGQNTIKSASYIEFGQSLLPTTGAIRLANFYGINSAGTGGSNIAIAAAQGNNLVLGGTSNPGTLFLDAAASQIVSLRPNAASQSYSFSSTGLSMGGSGAGRIVNTTGDLILSSTQATLISGSALGASKVVLEGPLTSSAGGARFSTINGSGDFYVQTNDVDILGGTSLTIQGSDAVPVILRATNTGTVTIDDNGEGGKITISGAPIELTGTGGVMVSGSAGLLLNAVPMKSASYIAVGSGVEVASSGAIRLSDNDAITTRYATNNSLHMNLIASTGAATIEIGTTHGGASRCQGVTLDSFGLLSFNASGGAIAQVSTSGFSMAGSNADIIMAGLSQEIRDNGGSSRLILSGANGINVSGSFIRIDSAKVLGNIPSAHGGAGVLYASGTDGAGVWIAATGTETVFGPAEPECPRCGIDYVIAARNVNLGWNKEMCLNCLMKQLDELGIKRSSYMIRDEGDF